MPAMSRNYLLFLKIRKSHSDIDWGGMGRFRDLAVHHYFGIDNRIVWNIVSGEVPDLLAALTTEDSTTP